MKILVTGATGFTGCYFVAAAEKAGHLVSSLQADLTDQAAVATEVMSVAPNAVVHLAGLSFVGHANDAAFYGVNVVGTMNLLAALAALPTRPAKVLLASSANVYGNCEVSPISEDQLAVPVNHYAMSKLTMETMARLYFDRLPIVITRPFNYTGPGQSLEFLIPKLIDHFARRATAIELGNLYIEREFNDVRMVCDAYLALLDRGQSGEIYNVCSGHPYTLQQVIEMLIKITGHQLDLKVNPAFVRKNEVHRLCGNPDKLLMCLDTLHQPNLYDTLLFMLGRQN